MLLKKEKNYSFVYFLFYLMLVCDSSPFAGLYQVELHLKPIQSLLRHQKPLVFVLNSPQQLMWKIKTENLAPGMKHTFHVSPDS